MAGPEQLGMVHLIIQLCRYIDPVLVADLLIQTVITTYTKSVDSSHLTKNFTRPAEVGRKVMNCPTRIIAVVLPFWLTSESNSHPDTYHICNEVKNNR